MSENFVRLPVDGNGKRLHSRVFIELLYDGGTVDFAVGDVVIGANSATSATVVELPSTNTTSSGLLVLVPTDRSTTLFEDNELLNVDGSPRASANGVGTTLFNQGYTLIGANAPSHAQKVDIDGAAYVRFSDGPQQLDALGHTQFSGLTTIGDYNFKYDLQEPDLIVTQSVGGGSVTYDSNNRALLLSVDNISGSVARASSRKYHKFFGGAGMEILGTILATTNTHQGMVRRVGLFDENDGVFFFTTGSNLGLVVRSSTSGTPVDTFISASSFNGSDPSNGPFNSAFINKYYIDFNPSGRVRFGIFDPDGTRRVLHTIKGLNSQATRLFKTVELPARAELINEQGTAGTFDYRVFDTQVLIQQTVVDEDLVDVRTHAGTPMQIITGSDHHMVTVRPKLLFNSGNNNTVGILDEIHTAVVTDGTSLIRVRVVKNATLTSASWTDVQTNRSAFEQTVITGTYVPETGVTIFEGYTAEMAKDFLVATHGTYLRENISLHPLLTGSAKQDQTYSVVYDLITGSNAPACCTFDLREVH